MCLVALCAAGCGSSRHAAATTTAATTTTAPKPPAYGALMSCLERSGYGVTPESPAELETAPGRFEFTAVWNLLNPSRIALAMTFSRNIAGAKKAVVWTRRTNARVGRKVVAAPVVRFGKIAVLWTATPGARSARDVYGCVRRRA
jgi:hypothetical protein